MDTPSLLRWFESRAKACQDAIDQIVEISEAHNVPDNSHAHDKPAAGLDRRLERALESVSAALAAKYRQSKRDLIDDSRESFSGVAHEIREMLAQVLRTLAPDAEVKRSSWFKPETERGDPSQKQRARFILEARSKGSKIEESVNEALSTLDDSISKLVRATYSRSSDAAHRTKKRERHEVEQIMRYFEALGHDLLDT